MYMHPVCVWGGGEGGGCTDAVHIIMVREYIQYNTVQPASLSSPVSYK